MPSKVMVLVCALAALRVVPTPPPAAATPTPSRAAERVAVAREPRAALPLAHSFVARGFDPPMRRWLAGHRGVDLAGHLGAEVRAPAPGVIRFAASINGVGIVSVAHADGLVSTYQPVRPLARVGMRVRTGEVVATLSAGAHCGSQTCLHWGAKSGGDYLNPLITFHVAPRLLPL